ncbi:MAG: hypothetical protein LBE07_02530 [Gordonia sp. (in: high G+C Gram-positive bacteria)]|jgi:sporulation protein YlmC with PRC-barrel domain|nr:hypothetical protein [Gordonia sp. (in: high G+C Gram-positive bacteria)]
MRAREWLDRRVVDDGETIGVVVDIRLEAVEGVGFEIVGLLVGPRKPLRLLGPHEADRSGPWLINWLQKRRDRQIEFIPWSNVREVGDAAVEVDR